MRRKKDEAGVSQAGTRAKAKRCQARRMRKHKRKPGVEERRGVVRIICIVFKVELVLVLFPAPLHVISSSHTAQGTSRYWRQCKHECEWGAHTLPCRIHAAVARTRMLSRAKGHAPRERKKVGWPGTSPGAKADGAHIRGHWAGGAAQPLSVAPLARLGPLLLPCAPNAANAVRTERHVPSGVAYLRQGAALVQARRAGRAGIRPAPQSCCRAPRSPRLLGALAPKSREARAPAPDASKHLNQPGL